MKYFLCLGSNAGNKARNLARALLLLEKEGLTRARASSLYETQPVDYPSKPWFYNQIVEVETDLSPFDLLAVIKKIEKKMGRKTAVPKGPRIMDIDIILAEETVIRTEELQIPHPRMERRNFVLAPLAEISAGTIHPLLQESVGNLWKKSSDRSIVRKIRTAQE